MTAINMTDGKAHVASCADATTCSYTPPAGDPLVVSFLSGSTDTGGGSSFNLTCPSGWTTVPSGGWSGGAGQYFQRRVVRPQRRTPTAPQHRPHAGGGESPHISRTR